VAVVRTFVLEERIASTIRVETINELRITLAVVTAMRASDLAGAFT
jgi:hypothetical protein